VCIEFVNLSKMMKCHREDSSIKNLFEKSIVEYIKEDDENTVM